MRQLAVAFEEIAKQTSMVKHHDFNSGEEQVSYFNFTFGTERAAELWQLIQSSIYENAEFAPHMRRASMAMCSSEEGWDDYLLLFHFDLAVEIDDAASL